MNSNNAILPDIAHKIVRNSGANIIRGVISLPILLLLTPFTISKIGTTGFGIWALTNVIVNYVGLMDLGIGAALVKHVSEQRARDREEEINILLSTSFVLCLCIGLAVFAVLFIGRGWIIDRFFHIADELKPTVSVVLVGSLCLFVFNLTCSVFSALLDGLQRMDLSNGVNLFGVVFNAAGVVVTLSLGYGLLGLLLVSGLTAFATTFFNAYLAKREFQALAISPVLFSLSHVRKLLSFSLQVQVVSFAVLVHTQLDKLVIAFFLGATYVAFYEVAYQVIQYLRGLPTLILRPIMPAASEMAVSKDLGSLQSLYNRALRYMLLAGLPLFCFIVLYADRLVTVWLGPGYEPATIAIRVLAIAHFVNLMTVPGYGILLGLDKPRYGAYFSLAALISNVLLSVILVSRIGFLGAVVGPALAMIVWGLAFIRTTWRILKTDVTRMYQTISYPVAASVGASLFIWMGQGFFGLRGWVFLGVALPTFCALYGVFLALIGYFDAVDKQIVVAIAPRALFQRLERCGRVARRFLR